MRIEGMTLVRSVGLRRSAKAVDHELVEHVRRLGAGKLRCASAALDAYRRTARDRLAPSGSDRDWAGPIDHRRPAGVALHDVEPHETLIRGIERQLDAVPDRWAVDLADAIVGVIDEELARRERTPRPAGSVWEALRGIPHRTATRFASPSILTASASPREPQPAHH